ncbi:Hypothetical_protein [Hexamita inflata]|uniref:Hypothetical_protein n=1 Tax=Hexamita inflata TaxID=28002 RepID=A0AA86PH45_9EUKA|nr:Hypothetical protein HINF_LOCUS23392 [Hexamita inflata]
MNVSASKMSELCSCCEFLRRQLSSFGFYFLILVYFCLVNCSQIVIASVEVGLLRRTPFSLSKLDSAVASESFAAVGKRERRSARYFCMSIGVEINDNSCKVVNIIGEVFHFIQMFNKLQIFTK